MDELKDPWFWVACAVVAAYILIKYDPLIPH